jgi:hypothetical protein
MVNPRLPHAVQRQIQAAVLRLDSSSRRPAWRALGRALLNVAGAAVGALGLSQAAAFLGTFPLASCVTGALGLGISGFCIFKFVAAAGDFPAAFGGRRARRVLSRYPDAYVDLDVFDRQAQTMWDPVASALASTDLRADFVDTIEASVNVPDELWGIAGALARQSRLRRRRGARLAIRPGQPQQQLDAAVATTGLRCRALLSYLRQQAEFAEVSRELDAIQNGHLYDEVLAATADDQLAIAHVGEMTARSRLRVRALRRELLADDPPGLIGRHVHEPTGGIGGRLLPMARQPADAPAHDAAMITSGSTLDVRPSLPESTGLELEI